jgi:hypothetical protein
MLLSKGTLPLSFGTPMGNDKADAPQSGGTAGGVGSQCGMMNGMPWIVAAASKPVGERSPGALFGVFVNTLGWVHGTATPETSNRDAGVRGLFFSRWFGAHYCKATFCRSSAMLSATLKFSWEFSYNSDAFVAAAFIQSFRYECRRVAPPTLTCL